MELTRKQVIEILEKADSTVYEEPKTITAYALEYAINSLKTDEAYQIMYEGGEIFTKDDMVAMLTEIQAEIEELKNEPACCRHFVRGIRRSSEVIQQKIDALKEIEPQESEDNNADMRKAADETN